MGVWLLKRWALLLSQSFDMLFLVLLKSVHDNYYLGGSCHGSSIRVLVMWFNFKHGCPAFISLMTLQIELSAMGL
jgi:hypothetical protein